MVPIGQIELLFFPRGRYACWLSPQPNFVNLTQAVWTKSLGQMYSLENFQTLKSQKLKGVGQRYFAYRFPRYIPRLY